MTDFDERLRCYYCYTALDGFRFYAKTGQQRAYEWTKRRITELI